jgi:hypothetical protein
MHNALVQNQTTSDSWQQLLEMPRKSWWAKLPFGVRMATGASALLLIVGGGAIGVATLVMDGDPKNEVVTEVGQAHVAGPALPPLADDTPGRPPIFRGHAMPPVARDARPADRTAPRPTAADPPRSQSSPAAPAGAGAAGAGAAATAGEAAAPAAAPVTTTRTEVETREIPFETRVVRDPALPRGTKRVETPGVPGVETLRYLVTVTDGRPAERELIDATVTKQPQHKVVAFGSRRNVECGQALRFCVPLGRESLCDRHPESVGVAGLGGSEVTLLDNIELAC